jgi:uncharacterized damage-inducible protein DinB
MYSEPIILFAMSITENRELWLRGPIAGIPPLLQPVAHALLQAREEVIEMTKNFPGAVLWERPAGVAPAGFHLQHLTGVLDRLFTYAKGQSLTPEQLNDLSLEGVEKENIHCEELVKKFSRQITLAIEQLHLTEEQALLEERGVGRSQIPSNVIGLLVHAAEHTQRHVGQLLVTIRILKETTH